jgi:hypothetical protein
LLFPSQGYADLVQPDVVLASSEFTAGFDGLAMNTINGSGLPVGFGPGDTHAAYVSGNHWTSNLQTIPTDQFINWGFNTPQTLTAIHIWNHQSTQPPADNPGYDVTLFDLTLFDAANTPLLQLNDVAMAPDASTGQTFSFGGPIANVSSVLFSIEAVQSSTDYTGLAEVAFSATPEPSSLWLVGGGILAIARATRSRRKSARCTLRG